MSATWFSRAVLLGTILVLVPISGCGRAPDPSPKKIGPAPMPGTGPVKHGIMPIDLPQGEQKPGAGVVVLVDTSGSMAQAVNDKDGKQRPKNLIARDALERIVQHTAQWKTKNPERPLQMGIYHFSSAVAPVLPMGAFDEAKARTAVAAIPSQGGGTAIGSAVEEGFKALYKSGSTRKYLIVITDGENTAGLPPDRVSRQLFDQTKGDVEIHFVAFDIAARQFQFLNAVNGHVVQAADGGQLQTELTKIYDQRIFAEAEDPSVK